MSIDIRRIRGAIDEGRVVWRYHALLRARQRGIEREQALRVIQEGNVVEVHPRARPYPKCLMMAVLENRRPLFVALSYDRSRDLVYVITVHWLDPRKWQDPWTRRSETT